MYCPNCEFEIKQEVTECPICGGVLMQHPDESPGNQPSGREAEEVPLDLHISNLLLDAKHELRMRAEVREAVFRLAVPPRRHRGDGEDSR